MTIYSIDVEADGPAPGLYSMISFGAVVVDSAGKLDQIFYGQLRPISDNYLNEALAVVNMTRSDCWEAGKDPETVMWEFTRWIRETNINGRPFFMSDNNGFDWQFINYYFHLYTGINPFGHSSTNLGSLYKGLVKDSFKNFKHLRITKHTHNPVDDAKGNAEALLHMIKYMGLKMAL